MSFTSLKPPVRVTLNEKELCGNKKMPSLTVTPNTPNPSSESFKLNEGEEQTSQLVICSPATSPSILNPNIGASDVPKNCHPLRPVMVTCIESLTKERS